MLLIGGVGDTVESWQFQLDGLADRYRLTAFDNRGAGRAPMPEGTVSVEAMADDAAGVLRALDISPLTSRASPAATSSPRSRVRHPELVRSLVLQSTWPVMDVYLSWARFVRRLMEAAPSERFLELSFCMYTARAHNDGMVDQLIEEVLAFPHKQRPRTCSPSWMLSSTDHRPPAGDRGADARARGRPGQDQSPGAGPRRCRPDPRRRFEVMEEEAHQPFQEVPDEWNARIDAFWREVEGRR